MKITLKLAVSFSELLSFAKSNKLGGDKHGNTRLQAKMQEKKNNNQYNIYLTEYWNQYIIAPIR